MVVWVSEGVGPLDGKAGPGRVTTSLRARTLALSTTAVGDVAPGSDGAVNPCESARDYSEWVRGDALRSLDDEERTSRRMIGLSADSLHKLTPAERNTG